MRGNLMTKKQRRDKESIAKGHRKKINGRRSFIDSVPALFAFLSRHRELSTALAARQSGEKG
jgi:hypothetical protein